MLLITHTFFWCQPKHEINCECKWKPATIKSSKQYVFDRLLTDRHFHFAQCVDQQRAGEHSQCLAIAPSVYTFCLHLIFTQGRPRRACSSKSEPDLFAVPLEAAKHILIQRCSALLHQQCELWYSQPSWVCENTSRRHGSENGSLGRRATQV